MFEAISQDAYSVWLSGTTGKLSVFERYGFVEEDGTDIQQTSHCFRHWINDIAHRKGLSTLDIAHWSGRDPSQNKYYDHQTPEQFQEQLLELTAKSDGMGPLFQAAENLSHNAPISKAEFMSLQIGSAHQTDFGACIHDYTLLPCQKFGNCFDCAENLFVKGDPKHKKTISERYGRTDMQLAAAKAAMEDSEYGADLWVKDHLREQTRLFAMLAIHDNVVIPDGTVVNMSEANSDTEVDMALRQRNGLGWIG